MQHNEKEKKSPGCLLLGGVGPQGTAIGGGTLRGSAYQASGLAAGSPVPGDQAPGVDNSPGTEVEDEKEDCICCGSESESSSEDDSRSPRDTINKQKPKKKMIIRQPGVKVVFKQISPDCIMVLEEGETLSKYFITQCRSLNSVFSCKFGLTSLVEIFHGNVIYMQ